MLSGLDLFQRTGGQKIVALQPLLYYWLGQVEKGCQDARKVVELARSVNDVTTLMVALPSVDLTLPRATPTLKPWRALPRPATLGTVMRSRRSCLAPFQWKPAGTSISSTIRGQRLSRPKPTSWRARCSKCLRW